MVEVNSSFYALPQIKTVENWIEQTPDDFVFDIKLPKLFSWHAQDYAALPVSVKALAQPDHRGVVPRTPDVVAALAEATAEVLEPLVSSGKMGVVLLQLSPSFSPARHTLAELTSTLKLLPTHTAVEFRNHDWLLDERLEQTLATLNELGAIYVNLDAPTGPHVTMMPKVTAVTTGSDAYLRCHGRNAEGYLHGKSVGERFDYEYTDAEIEEIAERVRELAKDAGRVHLVFNNNRSNYAPRAAEQISKIFN